MSTFDKSLFEVETVEIEDPVTRRCDECGIETTDYERVQFQDKSIIIFCADLDACSDRALANEDPRDDR